MTSGQILIVLCVASVTLIGVAVLRRAGIPAPVVLVVAGLIIGFLPFVPDVSLNPDLVLLGPLPLLVDAAVTSSPTGFLRDARSIGTLAVLLVIATAFAVAAVAHWLGHLSWPIAFVLGRPSVHTRRGRRDQCGPGARDAAPGGRPSSKGEALFNDATALVLYAAAVTAATTGHFSVLHTAGSIVYATVVGAAIGLAVGFAGRQLRNRIDDPPIEIAGSILLAYVAYLPAEEIHASGVLAAVSAGLYLGWHSSGSVFSARSGPGRVVLRGDPGVPGQRRVLFVGLGLSFHTFSAEARGPIGRLVLAGLGVVLTVIPTAWCGCGPSAG